MNRILLNILQKLVQQKTKKGRSTMTNTATTQNNGKKKFDVFKYAYGQIYSGYLKSGKAEKFVITNIHVREWIGIMNYFKKKEYIVDFKLGNTLETACDLGIVGLNEDNIPYPKYAEGVRNKVKKEMEDTFAEEVKEAA